MREEEYLYQDLEHEFSNEPQSSLNKEKCHKRLGSYLVPTEIRYIDEVNTNSALGFL